MIDDFCKCDCCVIEYCQHFSDKWACRQIFAQILWSETFGNKSQEEAGEFICIVDAGVVKLYLINLRYNTHFIIYISSILHVAESRPGTQCTKIGRNSFS